VFVHARNATIRVANVLKELAAQKNQLQAFEPQDPSAFGLAKKSMEKFRNRQVTKKLFKKSIKFLSNCNCIKTFFALKKISCCPRGPVLAFYLAQVKCEFLSAQCYRYINVFHIHVRFGPPKHGSWTFPVPKGSIG